MKFSTVVLSAGFAAMVAAVPQAVSSSSASVVAATYSADPAQASVTTCLNKCDASDVNCRAHCLGNPVPNAENISATNECEAKCPTTDGTAAQNAVLAACQAKCINNNYYTQTGATADHTVSPGYAGAAATSAAGTDVTVTAPVATGTNSAAISSAVSSVVSSISGKVSSSAAAVVTTIKQATTVSDASTTYVSTHTGVSTVMPSGTNSPSSGDKLHVKLSAAGVIGALVAVFAL